METILDKSGVHDTPVYGLWLDSETGKYRPVLVAWYNLGRWYKEEEFLTLRSFGTSREAEEWLQEFWDSYWRLGGR